MRYNATSWQSGKQCEAFPGRLSLNLIPTRFTLVRRARHPHLQPEAPKTALPLLPAGPDHRSAASGPVSTRRDIAGIIAENEQKDKRYQLETARCQDWIPLAGWPSSFGDSERRCAKSWGSWPFLHLLPRQARTGRVIHAMFVVVVPIWRKSCPLERGHTKQ